MPTYAEVRELALALSDEDRAVLASSLMDTLSDELAYEVESYTEAFRRDAEMNADPTMCITWEEVREYMKSRLNACR